MGEIERKNLGKPSDNKIKFWVIKCPIKKKEGDNA
jgi:hypothetical protein